MWPLSRFISLLAAPLLLASVVAGAHASSRGQMAMTLVKTSPAHILVNAKGMTLYVFAKDSKNKSTCTGQCAMYWPPAIVPMGAKVTSKMMMAGGTIGEMMLKGGGDQLTYDGAPLYTFASDKKPGDINGEGVGGIWWAVVAGTAVG